MATLKMGSTTVLTDTTLANAVQDNITRLGTVASGAIGSAVTGTIGTGVTFPAGHVIQTKVDTKFGENSAYNTASTLTRFVDSSGNLEWTGQITGVTAGNDVAITMAFVAYVSITSGLADGYSYGMFREGSIINEFTDGHGTYLGANYASNWYNFFHLEFLDENPGAGTHNYYLGGRKYSSCTSQIRSDTAKFQCFMQEIQR